MPYISTNTSAKKYHQEDILSPMEKNFAMLKSSRLLKELNNRCPLKRNKDETWVELENNQCLPKIYFSSPY